MATPATPACRTSPCPKEQLWYPQTQSLPQDTNPERSPSLRFSAATGRCAHGVRAERVQHPPWCEAPGRGLTQQQGPIPPSHPAQGERPRGGFCCSRAVFGVLAGGFEHRLPPEQPRGAPAPVLGTNPPSGFFQHLWQLFRPSDSSGDCRQCCIFFRRAFLVETQCSDRSAHRTAGRLHVGLQSPGASLQFLGRVSFRSEQIRGIPPA